MDALPVMDALIVVDMQVGLLAGAPKHDLQSVIGRINRLARGARRLWKSRVDPASRRSRR